MRSKEILNKNEINEITIIYDYNKSKDINSDDKERFEKELGETISREKLFGERFVKNNKNICKMIINGKRQEICSYLPKYQEYLNEGKLEMKLVDIKNLSDISYMFSGCLSLIIARYIKNKFKEYNKYKRDIFLLFIIIIYR